MRIGMMVGGGAGESPHADEVIRRAQRVGAPGLHSAWQVWKLGEALGWIFPVGFITDLSTD